VEIGIPKKKNFALTLTAIIFYGALMMFASIAIFNYIINGVYGPYAYTSSVLSMESLTEIFDKPVVRVAVLYSKKTEKMLPEGSTWIEDNIATWSRFLSSYKMSVDILQDEDIELGKHYGYDVLVLPGSKAISDEQVVGIKRYIDQGGSLMITSGLATFSEDARWRGWEFLSEIAGVQFAREINAQQPTQLHTLRGGLPITANIPTGFTLKVATWDFPIAMRVMEPRSTQVSFWYNYRKDDGLVDEQVSNSAGMVYGTYGKGKFVWMGFDLTSMVGDKEDYIYFDRLVHNMMNWLADIPIAFIRDWPGAHTAASLFLPVITADSSDYIRNLFPVLQRNKVRATFLVEEGAWATRSDLVKEASKYGDLAPIIDIGYLESVNDTSNKLMPLEEQINRLKSAKRELEAMTGSKVLGMKPMYGLFDDNTLTAMAQAGYNYIITDSLTDRSVPNLIIKDEKDIMVITKTVRDDYWVVRDYGLYQNDFQIYTYKEDIDRLKFEGGLYVHKSHGNYQLTPANIAVMDTIIRYMKLPHNNMWVTNLPDLYNWWKVKGKVEMRIEARGPRRIVVALSNVGGGTMQDFAVPINFTSDVQKFNISAEIIGTKLPAYTYEKESRTLMLRIEKLQKNESRIYYIDFVTSENKTTAGL